MPPVIIAITISGALVFFLLAFALLPRRSGVDKRLGELDRGMTGREGGGGFFDQLVNARQRSQLSRKLSAAGWYKTTPTQIVVRTLVGGIGGLAAGAALVLFVGDRSTLWLCAAATAVLGGLIAPTALLNRAAEARQKAVQRSLPDFIDMLATTIEAGVPLGGALTATLEAISGPLADELRFALSDIRLGRARSDALMTMAERVQQPDLLTAVIAIVQAERMGGSIVGVLEEIAVEAREARMLRIEELAAQLPVKMVFPMALFMLPALIVMIFGPVVANFLSAK